MTLINDKNGNRKYFIFNFFSVAGVCLRKKKLGPFKFAPRWADRRHLAAFSLDSDAARETIYTQVSDLALITPDLIWKQ